MLLWMSRVQGGVAGQEGGVELSDDVALQAADDLFLGQAIVWCVDAQGADAGSQHMRPSTMVCRAWLPWPVAAAVEPVAAGLAGAAGMGPAPHRFRLQQCVQQRRADHDPKEEPTVEALETIDVMDGDPVATEHIPSALTAGGFVYGDGATQVVFVPTGANHVHRARAADTR